MSCYSIRLGVMLQDVNQSGCSGNWVCVRLGVMLQDVDQSGCSGNWVCVRLSVMPHGNRM